MSESTSKLDVSEVVKDQTEFMSSELPTPRYAWVALFATWLISIAIPMAWFACRASRAASSRMVASGSSPDR